MFQYIYVQRKINVVNDPTSCQCHADFVRFQASLKEYISYDSNFYKWCHNYQTSLFSKTAQTTCYSRDCLCHELLLFKSEIEDLDSLWCLICVQQTLVGVTIALI